MNEKLVKCSNCRTEFSVNADSCPECGMVNIDKKEPKKKDAGVLLWVGVIFIPFIFTWLTLRKGYSKSIRITGFLCLFMMMAAVLTDTSEEKEIASAENALIEKAAPQPTRASAEVVAIDKPKEKPKAPKTEKPKRDTVVNMPVFSCTGSKEEFEVEMSFSMLESRKGWYYPIVNTNLPSKLEVTVIIMKDDSNGSIVDTQVVKVDSDGQLNTGNVELEAGSYKVQVLQTSLKRLNQSGIPLVCGKHAAYFESLGEPYISGTFYITL